MKNCSDEGKSLILLKYMNTLRISGYDQLYRFQVLKGVLVRQNQIYEEIALGNRVRYRSQSEIEEQKRKNLGNFANTWFLNDEISGILKVPCTPDSKLLSIVRQQSGGSKGPDGGSTKFVEMGVPLLP